MAAKGPLLEIDQLLQGVRLRGRIPVELNDDVAYRVARGYAQFLAQDLSGSRRDGAECTVSPRIVVGRDIRLSSAALTDAVCRGLNDSGADVYDIGICGTEGVYFATFDAVTTAASWLPQATIHPITTA